ncbi:MAG: dihydroxyacetone kinase subunit L [Planctomycetaceae bacterium]|jgi:dihydroxyacetone kinase-like protein|nr:dihydroxyacetone kinase subunit L [Planctomycetaceae bacterium]
MSLTFTKKLLQQIADKVCKTITANLDDLNKLDSDIGDGDHGTAMLAAMSEFVKSSRKEGSIKQSLDTIGWDVMSATSGSTSALIGAFFTGMSQGVEDNKEELDSDAVITMFSAGLKNLQATSKAKVGDKTMLDAVIPAVNAMEKFRGTGAALTEIFFEAAKAARANSNATSQMVAKHGRAKNLGERSLGHIDAGSSSAAFMFEAFANEIRENEASDVER